MSGLTSSGFVPETLAEITERIQGKLETFNPGFDFSPESPDGQLIDIMAYEIWNAWTQLDLVYNSYNPSLATGAALRNIAQITGIPYGSANRSYATVETVGTAGTIIPANSLVTDADGNEFYFAFATTIPTNAQVVCRVPGPVPVPAGTIVNIKTPVAGWTDVAQSTDGVMGTTAFTDQQYRNLRTSTVMRNYTSTVDTMQARLLELGIEQAKVFNNDSTGVVSGVPANTIAVTVGEVGAVDDESIATAIFSTNAAGCPTFGTTATVINDNQGYPHTINFTKAVEVPIEIYVDVTYLTEDSAGAKEDIEQSLLTYIDSLLSGEDVIWSRLFEYITPFGKAQVNTLTIGTVAAASPGISNILISDTEFASLVIGDLHLTETP